MFVTVATMNISKDVQGAAGASLLNQGASQTCTRCFHAVAPDHALHLAGIEDPDIDLGAAGASLLNQGASQTCTRYAISSATEDQVNFLAHLSGSMSMDPHSMAHALMADGDDAAPKSPQEFDGFQGKVKSFGGEWYSLEIRVRQSTLAIKELAFKGRYAPASCEMPTTHVIVWVMKGQTHAGVSHGVHCVYLTGFDSNTSEWVAQNSWGQTNAVLRIPFDDRYNIFAVDVCCIKRLSGSARGASTLYQNQKIALTRDSSSSQHSRSFQGSHVAGVMDAEGMAAGAGRVAEDPIQMGEQLPSTRKGWACLAKDHGITESWLVADPPSSMDEFRERLATGHYTDFSAGGMPPLGEDEHQAKENEEEHQGVSEEDMQLQIQSQGVSEEDMQLQIQSQARLDTSLCKSQAAIRTFFHSDELNKALEKHHRFITEARRSMPNDALIRDQDLKRLMAEAREEVDSHALIANDFIIHLKDAVDILSLLISDVQSLLVSGNDAIQRVKTRSEPWNYCDIERQVQSAEQRYSELMQHTQTNFAEIRKKLESKTGKSVGDFCRRIKGRTEMLENLEMREEEKRKNLLNNSVKQQECRSQIAFLQASKERQVFQRSSLERAQQHLQAETEKMDSEMQAITDACEEEVLQIVKNFSAIEAYEKNKETQPHDQWSIDWEARLSEQVQKTKMKADEAEAECTFLTGSQHRQTHFIILTNDTCQKLQDTLSQLRTARLEHIEDDKVTLMRFDYMTGVTVPVVGQSWNNDNLQSCLSMPIPAPPTSAASIPGMLRTWVRYKNVFTKAVEVMTQVCPDRGRNMDTVLILCTDGSPAVTGPDIEKAKEAYEQGCRDDQGEIRGTMSSFIVTSSDEGQVQVNLRPVTLALNGEKQYFTDILDNMQPFFCTLQTNEFLDRIHALTELSGDPRQVARLRTERHSEKLQELEIRLRKHHEKQREVERAAQHALRQGLNDLRAEQSGATIQVRAQKDRLLNHYEKRRKTLATRLKEAQYGLAAVAKQIESGEGTIRIEQQKIEKLEREYENMNVSCADTMQQSRRDTEAMDALGYFDGDALAEVLFPVHDTFSATRQALSGAMGSFKAAANPVAKLLNTLKQTNYPKTDEKAKEFKVFWAYGQRGVQLDRRDWRDSQDRKFSKVISFICGEGVKTEQIDNVARALSINDFIGAVEEEDKAKRAKSSKHDSSKAQDDDDDDDSVPPEQQLKTKLIDSLSENNAKLGDLAQDLASLEEEGSALRVQIRELNKKPDGETREEGAARRDELKGIRDDLKKLKGDRKTANAAVNTEVRRSFQTEINMVTQILRDVRSICHMLELEHGMSDAVQSLYQLSNVFDAALTDFLQRAQSVSESYSQRLIGSGHNLPRLQDVG